MNIKYTVEELMLNDSFLDYCNNSNSIHKNYWEQIIAGHPEQLKIIKEAKQLLALMNADLSAAEVANEINKIREIIAGDKNKNTSLLNREVTVSERLYVNTDGKLRSKKLKKILTYSTFIIALIFGIFYLNSRGIKSAQDKNFLVSTTYQNPKAARKQVVLPDGSIVILNSNSNILISPSFNSKDRKVQLSGEAFFKVKKDANKPFIVMNSEFSVTALGTSFYVHARGNNKNYSVNLLEGKVKVEPIKASGKEAYLITGEEAQWLPAQTKFTKKNFDTLALRQWVSGKISFNKTPVKQAIKQLEKWYAVNIEMQQNKLENVSITGDYADVPLDDVLKVICFSLSCKYSYSGTKIIIE